MENKKDRNLELSIVELAAQTSPIVKEAYGKDTDNGEQKRDNTTQNKIQEWKAA